MERAQELPVCVVPRLYQADDRIEKVSSPTIDVLADASVVLGTCEDPLVSPAVGDEIYIRQSRVADCRNEIETLARGSRLEADGAVLDPRCDTLWERALHRGTQRIEAGRGTMPVRPAVRSSVQSEEQIDIVVGWQRCAPTARSRQNDMVDARDLLA